MKTISEDYCDFEIAKLLKEKGFDEQTRFAYTESGKADFSSLTRYWNQGSLYACPSQSMAMKWLREVHGLFISIGNDDLDYNWQIFDVKNRTKDLDPTCLTESYAGYRKYELACTLAIKYCLENLI